METLVLSVSIGYAYILYILVRLGCHLVEELLQYVHFSTEQVRKIHVSLTVDLDAWKSILKEFGCLRGN